MTERTFYKAGEDEERNRPENENEGGAPADAQGVYRGKFARPEDCPAQKEARAARDYNGRKLHHPVGHHPRVEEEGFASLVVGCRDCAEYGPVEGEHEDSSYAESDARGERENRDAYVVGEEKRGEIGSISGGGDSFCTVAIAGHFLPVFGRALVHMLVHHEVVPGLAVERNGDEAETRTAEKDGGGDKEVREAGSELAREPANEEVQQSAQAQLATGVDLGIAARNEVVEILGKLGVGRLGAHVDEVGRDFSVEKPELLELAVAESGEANALGRLEHPLEFAPVRPVLVNELVEVQSRAPFSFEIYSTRAASPQQIFAEGSA